MDLLPCWITAALGLPDRDYDLYLALLRIIRNAIIFNPSGAFTIINNGDTITIQLSPNAIQGGVGIGVVQNPDGTFTITNTAEGTFVEGTTTIDVTGDGSSLNPYRPSIAPGALIGAGSTTITQNPDGTFTIGTSLTPTTVDDSDTIVHTGTGTAVDPYIFSLAPGALIGAGSATVTQNPDGTYTISTTQTPTSVGDTVSIVHSGTGTAIDPYLFTLAATALLAGPGIALTYNGNGTFTIAADINLADTPTIDVSGTGTVGDPYLFSLAPGALLAGAGISVTQAPNGTYTITNTTGAVVLADSPTIDVTGTGVLGDPYLFNYAPGSILPGTGISVTQAPNGVFTITNTSPATSLLFADTATIDVSGTGVLGDPYVFSFAPNSLIAGTGISLVQNPNGTYTITNSSPASALVFGNSATNIFSGTGTGGNPYVTTLAPGALLAGTGVTITQAPNGVFTINATAGGLQFWTEQYDATQGITSWNAVNSSIAAFRNITGITINRITLTTAAAAALGVDSVDFHQSITATFTAAAPNSGIFTGRVNRINPISNRSAILSGQTNYVEGTDSVVCGGLTNVVGPPTVGTTASSGVLAGQSNTVRGNSCVIMGGFSHSLRGAYSAILAGNTNMSADNCSSSVMLGGNSNGPFAVGNSWATSLIGVGSNNSMGDATGSVVLAGNTNTLTAVNSGIFTGTNHTLVGPRNIILGGNQGLFVDTTSQDSMIGVGNMNAWNTLVRYSAILSGSSNLGTALLSQNSAIVTGSGCSLSGTSTVSGSAVLCGTNNSVQALAAVTSSSVLSGTGVIISVSNTHNLLERLGSTRRKKAEEEPRVLRDSSAGGRNVFMQSSHSFAMGHEVTVGDELTDAQGSLTSGSYLTNTKKHSTLIGCYGDSGSASQYETLGICSGTYTDPKKIASIGRDEYGRGMMTSDGLSLTGSNIAYMFPKSSSFTSEDTGLFVKLNEDGTVTPCSSEDAMGVTVPRTGIILNSYSEHWHGKYERDDFDEPVMRVSYVDSLLEAIALLPCDNPEPSPLPTIAPFEEEAIPSLPRTSFRDDESYMLALHEYRTIFRETMEKKRVEYRQKTHSTLLEHRKKHEATLSALKEKRARLRLNLHEALLRRDGPDLTEWVIATYGDEWPELKLLKGRVLEPKMVPVISATYDSSRVYVSRLQRVKEWVPVVQHGVVKVRVEGPCKVGGFLSVKKGLGVSSEQGWRVIALKNNVATIMFH